MLCLYKNKKSTILKVEDIHPGAMMLLCDMNHNILFSHPSYSIVYQDESEKWDLYSDIKFWGGWNQTQKTAETAVRVNNSIINIRKI